jgi:hypothetical protein
MKRNAILACIFALSTLCLSQEVKVNATRVSPSGDQKATNVVQIGQVAVGAKVDLAVFEIPLGEVEVTKGQAVELCDAKGKRLAVGFVGVTTANNKGRQSIKFLVTEAVRDAKVIGLSEIAFSVNPVAPSASSEKLLSALDAGVLRVYATPTD